MLASKLLKIQIVEDDVVQAEILRDKLAESNPMASINVHKSGKELFEHLSSGILNKRFYFIVLDYFLETTENTEVLNGYDIIQLLNRDYPQIKVVLHSAYESDDGTNFLKIKEDYQNVIEFVKKSEHAHLSVQNLLRFTFMEWQLGKKRKRLKISLLIFVVILLLSTLHFLTSFLAV